MPKTKDKTKDKHSSRDSNNKPQQSPENPKTMEPESKIPPTNVRELRALVIQRLHSGRIKLPIDSLTLFRLIKREFIQLIGVKYCFRSLDILPVIIELFEKKAILIEEMSIGYRPCYLLMDWNFENLTELYHQYIQDLPNSMSEAVKIIQREREKFIGRIGGEEICCNNTEQKEEQSVEEVNLMSMNAINPINMGNRGNITGGSMGIMGLDILPGGKGYPGKYDSPPTIQSQVVVDIDALINKPTSKEATLKKSSEQLGLILNKPTMKEQAEREIFKSKGGSKVREYCKFRTKANCVANKQKGENCILVHFKKIIQQHTDLTQGDCSYLDTCRHRDTCKFVHYVIDDDDETNKLESLSLSSKQGYPSQWMMCDLREIELTILGKFDVVLADPPWDIHMELPYGTMKDDEMKSLNIGKLQDDGVIFLWVTGRAMEVGRECLKEWGYRRTDELIWVKTNQLQRIIRTGRTGHWLNHSKEHCLIGIKGNPIVNRGVDCDVLVSEVRETSRKPDELYELIERLHPYGRKIELFARPHNRRHNWLSLGNQLPGTYIRDQGIISRWNSAFPSNPLDKDEMEQNRNSSVIEVEEGVKAQTGQEGEDDLFPDDFDEFGALEDGGNIQIKNVMISEEEEGVGDTGPMSISALLERDGAIGDNASNPQNMNDDE